MIWKRLWCSDHQKDEFFWAISMILFFLKKEDPGYHAWVLISLLNLGPAYKLGATSMACPKEKGNLDNFKWSLPGCVSQSLGCWIYSSAPGFTQKIKLSLFFPSSELNALCQGAE